jgi:hypothetical protein
MLSQCIRQTLQKTNRDTSQGVQNFERPRSNFFGSFYYTLNIFVSKNASQVWPLVWRGWWVRR